MNKKIIQLKHSIPYKTDQGQEMQISTLTMGRMKAKHLKHFPKEFFKEGGADDISPYALLPLIASVCGISNESAGEIDVEDINQVADALGEVMGKLVSPETGKS